MLYQNLAHVPGGDSDKVRTPFVLRLALLRHPHPGFVHKRCGLERVARPLVAHVPAGQAAQFRFHERHERIEGGVIAVLPL